MSHRSAHRGFTLIELLVVISIIALLMAMLLPALRSSLEAARRTGCLSNERQLGLAFNMYINDYDEHTPFAGDHDIAYDAADEAYSFQGHLWHHTLPQYLNGDPWVADGVPALSCPSAQPGWGPLNYTQPYQWWNRLQQPSNVGKGLPDGQDWGGAVFVPQINRPAQVMAFGDARSRSTFHATYKTWSYNGVANILSGEPSGGFDSLEIDMHRDGLNSLYVDGHAEALPLDYVQSEWLEGGNGADSTLLADDPDDPD